DQVPDQTFFGEVFVARAHGRSTGLSDGAGVVTAAWPTSSSERLSSSTGALSWRLRSSVASSFSSSAFTEYHCARALRTHKPARRAALGMRSGPNTIRATIAVSSISLKPTSNIARSGLLPGGLVFVGAGGIGADLRIRIGRR